MTIKQNLKDKIRLFLKELHSSENKYKPGCLYFVKFAQIGAISCQINMILS